MANTAIDLDIHGRGLSQGGAHGFGIFDMNNEYAYGADFIQVEALDRLREVSTSGTPVRKGDFVDRDFDGRRSTRFFNMYSSKRLSRRLSWRPQKSSTRNFQLPLARLVGRRSMKTV